jgi:nitrite reductase/ring-hydroxylating ferredoxin subunit
MTVTDGISRRNAIIGVAAAGLATPVVAGCGAGGSTASPQSPNSNASTPGGGGSTPATGGGFAATSDIPVGSGSIFPSDGVVVTQPTKDTFNGFSSTCTHQGCPLANVTETINCACHGSQFSIEDGSNVAGPNGSPAGSVPDLPKVELAVKAGEISKA